MNAIQYALQYLRRYIPPEILTRTFTQPSRFNNVRPLDLDSIIRDKVINDIVMKDCNVVGGTLVFVPLNKVPREIIDPWTVVYRIPKELTQGRSITHVISIAFGEGAVMGTSNIAPTQGNTMLDTAANILNSNMAIPLVSTAQATLVGDNVVMVADNIALPLNIYLRCWVENDSEMSNIKPPAFMSFAKLVLLATKAYIYNVNLIPMDRAYIFSGADLGRFKEVVDGYSDAQEQYLTHLEEVWKKTVILSDYQAKRRWVSRMVGGAY